MDQDISKEIPDEDEEISAPARAADEIVKYWERDRKDGKELWFRTGCDLLDLAIGGGLGLGIPAGRILNIVGDKSAGKTFLAVEIIAAAVHSLGRQFAWEYDDSESGFTFDTMSTYGFDIKPSGGVRSRTVQEAHANVLKFIRYVEENKLAGGIYVIDSLDGLTSDEIVEREKERLKKYDKGDGSKDEGSYLMQKQKFLSSEMLPGLAEKLERTNVLLVVISQVRDNIDMFSFEKQKRSGGKALDFYCNSVLWLAGAIRIVRKGRPVGNIVRAKLTKSKTPRPYRQVTYSILYDYGIDNIGSNVDWLFGLRTEKELKLKTNATAIWNGLPKTKENLEDFVANRGLEPKGRSKDSLLAAAEEHEDFARVFGVPMERGDLIDFIIANKLEGELTERVRMKWEQIEAEIKTKRPKKYDPF
jgi:recombination protein RecA